MCVAILLDLSIKEAYLQLSLLSHSVIQISSQPPICQLSSGEDSGYSKFSYWVLVWSTRKHEENYDSVLKKRLNCICVCVCARARAHACMHACTCACTQILGSTWREERITWRSPFSLQCKYLLSHSWHRAWKQEALPIHPHNWPTSVFLKCLS